MFRFRFTFGLVRFDLVWLITLFEKMAEKYSRGKDLAGKIPSGRKKTLQRHRYGHTVKICRETIATCARCSCKGHNNDKFTSTEVRCCHCGEDHQAFSRKQKTPSSKQNNAYSDYRPYENFSD